MENNVYDIQKNYTQVALDWIQEYQWNFSEKNKKELLKLLQQTEQEFIQKVQLLPKETIQDKWNRKLLSMTELKYKLIQDIAIKLIWWIEKTPSLRNMKQLVTYITWGESKYIEKELLQNLNQIEENIPTPDVKWKIKHIGEIILPPDLWNIITWSWAWWNQKEHPAGFDKIGLVERFLSQYFKRERKTFQWKVWVLQSNQIRKMSYYHLYLPEINKTLLLNNQYWEWCFFLKGDFNNWNYTKNSLKNNDCDIITFDYKHPEIFLWKLSFFLSESIKDNLINWLQEIQIENKDELIKQNIKKYFDTIWYDKLMQYSQEEINLIDILWNKIRTIATQCWFKTIYALIPRTVGWFQEFISYLYEKDFDPNIKKLTNEKIEKYFDAIWYDKLMQYNQEEIRLIDIWWNKIKTIATQHWFKSQYNLNIQNIQWFQEFINYIFNKKFVYKPQEKREKEELTKDKIKKYFDKIWYNKLMQYTKEEIKLIDIWWNKIKTIATQNWFKTQYSLRMQNVVWFQEFINDIFNKKFVYIPQSKIERKELRKEEIKEYFDKIWYDKLMQYSQEQIKSIDIWWNKIKTIATQYWFKTQYCLEIRLIQWFQEFINYIFNKKFIYTSEKKEELTKEKIKEYFDEIWYEKLMKYNLQDINSIDIWWNKITKIATEYWFKTIYNLRLWTVNWFKEFISSLYGKKFHYNRESNNDILKNF